MKLVQLLFAIAFILFAGCQGKKSKTQTDSTYPLPDSSIVHFLRLRNAASTPDSIKAAIKDNVVVLSTSDETRFLIAYQYPGDPPGSFIGFDLLGLSSELAEYPYKKTTLENFETENGITLVPFLDEILKKKGSDYVIKEENGLVTYTWYDAPPDFLKRYNSSEYLFEVSAMDSLVTRIRFGLVPDSANEVRALQKINDSTQ